MPPQSSEWDAALRGQLYHAFVPELVAARDRCVQACTRFNNTPDISRRTLVALWRDIVEDPTPLPPPAATSDAEHELFSSDPWILGPIRLDYGCNVKIGPDAFINANATFVDTCLITIGARTLVGPNCSFYSGTHPLDPALRSGIEGPELGKEITIGEDCWLGGNVIVLPGVRLGKGVTIGAGSVVTRDVPAFHVAAGNPARVLRRIETAMDPEQSGMREGDVSKREEEGAEGPMRAAVAAE